MFLFKIDDIWAENYLMFKVIIKDLKIWYDRVIFDIVPLMTCFVLKYHFLHNYLLDQNIVWGHQVFEIASDTIIN